MMERKRMVFIRSLSICIDFVEVYFGCQKILNYKKYNTKPIDFSFLITIRARSENKSVLFRIIRIFFIESISVIVCAFLASSVIFPK